MIWDKYLTYLILGGIVLSFSGYAWFIGNGDGQIAKLSRPQLLFSTTDKVAEISDGSMERLTALLQKNEISAVFLYAPWCGQSLVMAHKLKRAVKLLYKEISFIAINCWIGSCNKLWRPDQFPKVIAFHSYFIDVEYKGPHKTSNMVGFLQSIIRPFIYIGTDEELNTAKKSNQELIISYFREPMTRNKNFTTFFNLTLHFRAKESTPTFAVVTSDQLALKAGLTYMSGVVYHRLNHAVLDYPPSFNFTVENLTNWIDANRYKLVVELSLRSDSKGQFVDQLSKGPALILFLPLKVHMNQGSQHILHSYISTASEYFYCSCRQKTNPRKSALKNSPLSHWDMTAKTFKQDFVHFNEEMLHTLQAINVQNDWMIPGKDWRFPMFLASKGICQSLQFPQQTTIENKRNVCDVCYFCQNQNCELNLRLGVQSLLTEMLSVKNGCSSFRSGYYQVPTLSICCRVQRMGKKDANLPFQVQQNLFYLKAFKEMKVRLGDLFDDLSVALGPRFTKETFPPRDNIAAIDVQSSPQQRSALKEYDDFVNIPIPSIDGNDKNVCMTADNATQFTGAGCFSNRSMSFFIMDSSQYWSVAEKFGVRNTPKGRTALVIADLEADAQFVLEEELQITNESIVAFVMSYMRGNLSRRFTSSSPTPNSCLASQSCVIEVVSSNFREIVLDKTKDVFLLYYAPWCAFCQVLWPVLLAVAKFFHKTTGVIIARINADENDLPWEFYVSRYPSFTFFPAYRKDYAVHFPDSMERTGANIIQFILEHGVMARKAFRDFHLSRIVTDQLNHLEELLHQIQEEKKIIEIALRQIILNKELWKTRNEVSLGEFEKDVMKEQELRLQCEDGIRSLDQKQFWVEERVQKLIQGSANVLKTLLASENKLKRSEKHVSELLFEKKRFVPNAAELDKSLRWTGTRVRVERKLVLELRQTLTVIRQKATKLDISSKMLRTKLNNLLLKESCTKSYS